MSEIRVDSIGNESNTGGPVLSGVTEFSGQQYFIPPTGNTAERPSDCPPGSIRFNTDSAHLEYWNGIVWLEFEASSEHVGVSTFSAGISARGTGHRGLFAGGYAPGDVNTIDYISISTFGNAIEFGELTEKRRAGTAVSDGVRAIWWGGRFGPTLAPSNTIDRVTIASTGSAVDFGDNKTRLQFGTGCSNATRGVYGGGYEHSPLSDITNSLYYITMASDGDSIDFGDVSSGHHHKGAGCQSPVRGIFAGGINPSPTDVMSKIIDYITISTLGNALDFGDLTGERQNLGGCSNAVRGIFGGGRIGSSPFPQTNIIDYITIASTGNAIDFGDRTATNSKDVSATSSSTRAIFVGNYLSSADSIEAAQIATTGNSVDFGDLTQPRLQPRSTSNGHGGL